MTKQPFQKLWPNGPEYHAGSSFPLSTDSILLADFAMIHKNDRVLDLGCGSGILGLLLLTREPSLQLTNLDIQQDAIKTARENLSHNSFNDAAFICDDLCNIRSLLLGNSFDAVISNPPYYAEKQGLASPEQCRSVARSDSSCSISELCSSAAFALRSGGSLFLSFKPNRMTELFRVMAESRIEPKRLRLVQHSTDHKPGLILVEGRLDGHMGLTVDPSLILYQGDEMTAEAKRIYHIEEES